MAKGYATYIHFAGCNVCDTKKVPLTVKGPDDTLFCSEEHRDIYLKLQENDVAGKLTIAETVRNCLKAGHRVSNIMREHKLSYAYVKSIKDDLSGTSVGARISVNGVYPFHCSCGNNSFTPVFRTDEYKCMACGGLYTGVELKVEV